MLTDDEIKAQVLAAFQEEQAEHRQAAGELLLELERRPEHPQRQAMLDKLFREAHSLKGGARAAGQDAVEQIAHLVEDLFSAVRQHQLALTANVCDPIYEALDTVGVLMRQVAVGQAADLTRHQPLLDRLAKIRDSHTALPPLVHQNGHQPPEIGATAPALRAEPAADAHEQLATVRLATTTLDQILNETGELLTCAVSARQRVHDLRAIAELPTRWRRTWRQIRPAISRARARAAAIQPITHFVGGSAEPTPVSSAAPHSTDHDTARLIDALEQANVLIGSLEQRLMTAMRDVGEDSARLSAATDRLHGQIRRTRMLPLATLFTPLRLQLREMARAAAKDVDLILEDDGAEADRQVLDQLREALIHLLRNAIDHGIELPERRRAVGKAAAGRIVLRSSVGGEQLSVTLSDDGAGLDLAQIRQQALSSGALNEADMARVSEQDLADLIFAPGFTTRQTVSALSGRGVGLDIVRSQVERMHGRVSVRSTPGAGCAFLITVPLSLTTSHCLLVRAGAITYAIPIDAVQRIVMVGPHDMLTLEGRAAMVIDDRPLPLLALSDVLGEQRPAGGVAGRRLALLLGAGERMVVCMVDAVLGERELVTQRLPAPLQQVDLIVGATILADGSIVPVLDSVDLLRAALSTRRAAAAPIAEETPAPVRTVLVADDSITTRTLEKNILEAAGYRVCLATDGVEALHLLDQMADAGGCDLLLSDVDMPRLNGFDLTSAVRADARFRHLPVVLVTSLDTPADRERGIAAGADAYIVKRSFDQQTLLETIAQLL